MARIKKGVTVTILSGKDKGKTGKVLQIWPERERALVERINLAKHFERRSQQHPSGGVVERENPIALAKLAVTCSACRKATRVRWRIAADGTKQRLCQHCQGVLV
jgi:large subunit ribosomal protein L24